MPLLASLEFAGKGAPPQLARPLHSPRRVRDDPRRSIVDAFARFLGEFLREMAVLIAVFAPLDAFSKTTGLTVSLVVATISIVTAFFVIGVLLEVKRP